MTTDVKTAVNLTDILDLPEFHRMRDEKRISITEHPTIEGLRILNYTPRAMFLNEWTNSERQCRGLIVDHNFDVVARGPAKFFNYGQTGAPEIKMDDLTRVSVKHDGSLGIGWTYKGEFGIATRGSFNSEQAIHATALLTEEQKGRIERAVDMLSVAGGMSVCYEIVYPDNRIVLDYGTRDELIELGEVDNLEGKFRFRPEEMYRGGVMTFAEALRMPIPEDEEGYVLDVQPFGRQEHVKLKGERYKAMHALLTNTSAKRVWVQLAARACEGLADIKQFDKLLGHDPADFARVDTSKSIMEDLLTNVPDEFYDWVSEKIESIESAVEEDIEHAVEVAEKIRHLDNFNQFDAVRWEPMQTSILRYARTGNKDSIVLSAWRRNKPSGVDTPFRSKEED